MDADHPTDAQAQTDQREQPKDRSHHRNGAREQNCVDQPIQNDKSPAANQHSSTNQPDQFWPSLPENRPIQTCQPDSNPVEYKPASNSLVELRNSSLDCGGLEANGKTREEGTGEQEEVQGDQPKDLEVPWECSNDSKQLLEKRSNNRIF